MLLNASKSSHVRICHHNYNYFKHEISRKKIRGKKENNCKR